MTVLARTILVFFMVFQSVSGLYGGINLVLYPDGSSLQMPLSFLKGTPFQNYLIPGIILFLLLGLLPLFLIYPLIKKPGWKWASALNIYKDMHWSWTYALYVSIMLILWIDIQIFMLGYSHPIQATYAILGVLLNITVLLPVNKRYYEIKSK